MGWWTGRLGKGWEGIPGAKDCDFAHGGAVDYADGVGLECEWLPEQVNEWASKGKAVLVFRSRV